MKLKNILLASVPAALLAGTQTASADEVQSVAAQVIAQIAQAPAAPTPQLPAPQIQVFSVSGMRP